MRAAALLAVLATARAALASTLDGGARDGFLIDVLTTDTSTAQGLCRPAGQIADACCHFSDVEQLNGQIADKLDALVRTPFFRLYKTSLYRECPFWTEQGSCMNRACGVDTLADESLLPEQWRGRQLSDVKPVASSSVPSGLDAGCVVTETDFCVREDEASPEGEYVDLIENPERFTGYAGHSAHKVWKAIYEENCFGAVPYLPPSRGKDVGGTGFAESGGAGMEQTSLRTLMSSLAGPRDIQDTETCLEKRVFYRIISGLHASISIHICKDYLNQTTGEWEPNLDCFVTRIAQHPERLQNVYFNYVLMLRAFAKIGSYLREFDTCTGDEAIDASTRAAVADLADITTSCPTTFDERSMFAGPDAAQLKLEFREHFRNTSRIMDCVGCDKCRLWGKLQVTGLGTALKLLFSVDEDDAAATVRPRLERSEVVAFVNTFQRFAASLASIETFRSMWADRQAQSPSTSASSGSPVNPSSTAAPSPPAPSPDRIEAIVNWRPKALDRALAALNAARSAKPDPLPRHEPSINRNPPPRRRVPSQLRPQNKAPSVFAPRRSDVPHRPASDHGPPQPLDALVARVLTACRDSWTACVGVVARVLGRTPRDEL